MAFEKLDVFVQVQLGDDNDHNDYFSRDDHDCGGDDDDDDDMIMTMMMI